MAHATDGAGPTRREVLKLGLAGSAVLATASLGATLSGCGARQQAAAAGYRFLRDADLALFRAVMAPALGDLPLAPAMVEPALRIIDEQFVRAAARTQGRLHKLFDLLHFAPLRRFGAGLRRPWAEAEPAEVAAALERLRSSGFGLFTAAYFVLTRLVCLGYFGQPAGYTAVGYRPLPRVFDAVNA
jgi:hypothetical protein